MTTPLDPNIDRAVFVHTRGRTKRQWTYDWFTEKLILDNNVRIVCPKFEVAEHEAQGRLVIPCPVELGLPKIRQWLLEYAYRKGLSKIIFVDDDFTKFYVRITEDSWHLRDATKKEVEVKIIKRIFDSLDTYAMVGISHRSGNNRFFPNKEVEMVRMFSILGHRVDVFHDEGFNYDRTGAHEDFDVELQHIERGYPTLCLTNVAYGPLPPNTAGGCSIYRDNDYQKKSCETLRDLHPESVKIVTRKTKVWAGGGMGERYDVHIMWKRALGIKA